MRSYSRTLPAPQARGQKNKTGFAEKSNFRT